MPNIKNNLKDSKTSCIPSFIVFLLHSAYAINYQLFQILQFRNFFTKMNLQSKCNKWKYKRAIEGVFSKTKRYYELQWWVYSSRHWQNKQKTKKMSWLQNTFRGLLFKNVALNLTFQEQKKSSQSWLGWIFTY